MARLLPSVSKLLGVQVASNLLFALCIILLLGVCLHLSWELSVVEDENRTLAEEVAILRSAVERVEAGLSHLERRPDAPEEAAFSPGEHSPARPAGE